MSKNIFVHKDNVFLLDADSNLVLQELQTRVDGYIETYPLFSNVDAIFNDEGLLRDMEKT